VAFAVVLQPWRAGLDTGRDTKRPLLSLGHISSSLALIWRAPELRQLSIMSFAYAGMQNSFAAFLVTYLHERLAMSLVEAGLVLTIAQVAGAVARVIWGTLTDRFMDPYKLLGGLGLGMSACAILTASFTTAWPFWLIVAVGVAFGTTTAAWNGVFLAQIAMLAPVGRVSEATGGSQFCTFAGVTIMPGLFSAVLALTDSYAIGFTALAVLTVVSGLWILAPNAARRRKA
jgi:fucose permease